MRASIAWKLGLLCMGGALLCAATAAETDPVLRWNETVQQTVAELNPFFQSRTAAIAQLAVLDARRRAMAASIPPDVAGAVAAHDVLAALFPDSAAQLDSELQGEVAGASPEAVEAGHVAAASIIEARSGDGWDAKTAYVPGSAPGTWVPTPPTYAPALLPHWGRVKPFVISRADEFRPGPPPAPDSAAFIADLHEVMEMGAEQSAARPPGMTDVAHFWLSSPVQGWNAIARQAAVAAGHSPAENAVTLAMLNAAIVDAQIACFDAKFAYNAWRPVTAIRAGVGDLEPDPEWLPLIPTPPFPGYPSAHACSAGAAQEVLEHRFGPDGHEFELTSKTAPGVTFHYTSFAEIADQIDDARVYGGIHTREDQTVGRALGRKVGARVYEAMANLM